MSNEGRSRYWSFVAWTVIGAAACLALLTLLTIGPFVLVAVVAALAVLIPRRGSVEHGITGLLSGAGLLALYIAYLNRDGPGDVCRSSATEQSCTSERSPWPWLVVGLVLVAVGVALFRRAARGRGSPPSRRPADSSL